MSPNKQVKEISQLTKIAVLFASYILTFSNTAFAKDPLEAAQDLAGVNQSDPNGFTLMLVSIGMLFLFAITLIVATSIHVFKKKPQRQTPQV